MEKCLITGSTGLIGSSLVSELQNDYSLVLPTRRPFQDDCENIRRLNIDLTNPNFSDALPHKMDYVIHLAQSERYRDFPEGVEDVFDVNVRSSLLLLDYAKKAGVKTFILASSGVVYEPERQGIKEDRPLTLKKGNLGFYYTTKLCAEALAENYADCMNIIILRFFFVYGLKQRKSMLIPRLIQSVIDGRAIQLHGNNGMLMNPIHVSDAVNAVTKALKVTSSDKFNIAGTEVLSMRQICTTIGNCVQKEPSFDVKPESLPQHLIGDTEKMKSLLCIPKVTFKQGIEQYISNASVLTSSK